ncbi:hypothetical protein BN7_4852 [Wickerhamomyces ciferrii]|uniref:Core domain-containing protein n=1 Tax=Wickerhamomyces ciferrii (strain ATCC 14091 / BCRC 22168 / CBS 111 / JCM 3599 / NBRC 0793 / NRRL Y-1031 F-60-10) TaxID=1206466 RepID=K0KJ83_WICCF|nr:uncharacterized protein BN7_4852 [Wickerhamomyces ciferrii]CCH45270.1 hypothetical protein BN7_4852 [Wickerhamomyces ciferrii]
MLVTRVLPRVTRQASQTILRSSTAVLYPTHLFQKYSTSNVTNEVTNKRAPTSLGNTTRSFLNQDAPAKMNIINKKYTDEGKLLSMDLTDRAVERLQQIVKEESNPEVALRVNVESGGCHGFQYNLQLSDTTTKTEDDCIFEKNGAKLIIDESSLNILRESKIDYTKELIGSMFKVVDSPYTTSSCGCGGSFDFDFSKLEG